MRFLFVSAPLPGHLDWGGFLPTAAEMQRRGHAVLWASGDAVREQVKATNVPFHALVATGWRWPPPSPMPPPRRADDPDWQRLRALRALDQWLDVGRVNAAVDELKDVATGFQPDVVISEMFVAAAGIVAETIGTPFAVAGWPARVQTGPSDDDELVRIARSRLAQLLAHAGAKGVNWTTSGPPSLRSPLLHVTYWSPSWYAGMALEPQTVHVGGVAAPGGPQDATLPDPADRPWVLITLGTSFNDDPNFFIIAAHAADRLGCLPLVVVGKRLPDAGGLGWRSRLPASAVVRDHLDFAAVLPFTVAAIHHGGAGTTHALVTHAVPQIVVPHAADQMHQAQGVARSGVGFHLPARQATSERMGAALAAILPDLSPQRARAQALCTEFAGLGGVPRAADLIQSI